MIRPSLTIDGYQIHRALLSDGDVAELRSEADIVARAVGGACVRHLRRRSRRFNLLSISNALLSRLPADLAFFTALGIACSTSSDSL